MKSNHANINTLSPAGYIIKTLGVKRISSWTGVSQVQVRRWDYPKEKGGSGGLVPSEHIQKIVECARDCGFSITYSDFFQHRIYEDSIL